MQSLHEQRGAAERSTPNVRVHGTGCCRVPFGPQLVRCGPATVAPAAPAPRPSLLSQFFYCYLGAPSASLLSQFFYCYLGAPRASLLSQCLWGSMVGIDRLNISAFGGGGG